MWCGRQGNGEQEAAIPGRLRESPADHRLHVTKPHAVAAPLNRLLSRLILSFSLIRDVVLLAGQSNQGHVQGVNEHGEAHINRGTHGKAPARTSYLEQVHTGYPDETEQSHRSTQDLASWRSTYWRIPPWRK